ncbi:MAG: HAD family hydrolase [Planctomycetes bacterium]|nr:HAD family hydrolase [Planctomycetota bacterium]
MAQELEAIVFDFDYTLADSSVPVIDCVNYALGRLGLPAAPPEAIRRTIGLGLPEKLQALAGEDARDRAGKFRPRQWSETKRGKRPTVNVRPDGGWRSGPKQIHAETRRVPESGGSRFRIDRCCKAHTE